MDKVTFPPRCPCGFNLYSWGLVVSVWSCCRFGGFKKERAFSFNAQRARLQHPNSQESKGRNEKPVPRASWPKKFPDKLRGGARPTI